MRQGRDGEGEGSGNSARPQNLEPSHTVVIVRRLLTFVKGTRAKLFRRCALSPTNRKVYFQFQCGPVVRERKIYSSSSSLASSRMPTRTSPHLPIPAPHREQVTRLSFVAWSGTTNLLLPHFRRLSGACSGMALASILVRLGWDYASRQT